LSGLTDTRKGVMVKLSLFPLQPLGTRVAALAAVAAVVIDLLRIGQPPALAVGIALITAAGGVEVGCRLTAPHPAPFVRLAVLVVILVFVVVTVRAGYPAPGCIGIVLATSWCAAAIARRLTGESYRWPVRLA
jgi:hypothetical protein